MKTDFTDTQEKIIAILDRSKEAGVVGHVLQARVQVHGVSLSQEVRLLNEMMQEDIVIWTRVKRDGSPRRAGTEVLYLLAQYASEIQIENYALYREKLTRSVTERTVTEGTHRAIADVVTNDIYTVKQAVQSRHIREAYHAHRQGDIVGEAKAMRKVYAIQAELEGL